MSLVMRPWQNMSISKKRYLKYHENLLGQESGVRDAFPEKGVLEIALEG